MALGYAKGPGGIAVCEACVMGDRGGATGIVPLDIPCREGATIPGVGLTPGLTWNPPRPVAGGA